MPVRGGGSYTEPRPRGIRPIIAMTNVTYAALRPPATRLSARQTTLLWLLIAAVLASGVVAAIYRGVKQRPDWGDLQNESRYVWEHGRSAPGTAMFGYLPTTTFALWPFTAWLPQPLGLILYVGTNVAAAVLSILIVYRWWFPKELSAQSFVWPVLLVCANLQHALQSNQLTLWTLLLCVAGLTLVGRGRDFLGGVFLGLAALIKIMPGLLVAYLVFRRRWRALVGVGFAVVAFDLLPSLVFFGWQGTVDEHRAWLRRAEWHSNRRLIADPLLRVHRHGTNASLAAVLARWLRAVPDATQQVILYGNPPAEVVAQYRATLAPNECLSLDPMPPHESTWAEKRVDISWVPRFRLANLPANAVWWLWASPLALGLVVLAWFTWRTRDDPTDWVPVSALWMLAMFWPSPMTRHYYLAWAFPALVVVWSALVAERSARRRWSPGAILATVALLAWVVGVAGLGSKLLRWYGLHLAVLALLTAATAWAWYRQVQITRRPPTHTPVGNGACSTSIRTGSPASAEHGNAARSARLPASSDPTCGCNPSARAACNVTI